MNCVRYETISGLKKQKQKLKVLFSDHTYVTKFPYWFDSHALTGLGQSIAAVRYVIRSSSPKFASGLVDSAREDEPDLPND